MAGGGWRGRATKSGMRQTAGKGWQMGMDGGDGEKNSGIASL